MVMSAAQDYYEQVLGMGHTPENALAHTRQHYPDFIPGVAEAVAPPVMTPVSQQAVPVAQNVALPGVAAAPAVAAPAAPVAPVAAPAATAPNAYAPLATTPLPGGGTTPMMWAAVGCIVFALLLSMAGQFSHAWVTFDNQEGVSTGLTTIKRDCSFDEDIEECKQSTYRMYSENWMETSYPKDGEGVGDVITGEYEDYCNNLFTMQTENGWSRENAEDARDTCLEAPGAGGMASLILWLGTIGALLGTVMLSAGAIGRSLPAEAERHGKWAAMAAGALALLAVLAWSQLMPESVTETSLGMGVWMTVLGGVLGLVAGVLAYMDQK